jgi:hypothetical protein
MRAISYSKVDAAEERRIMWLIQERGVRDKNDDQPQDRGWFCRMPNQPSTMPKRLIPVNYTNCTPGDFVASGSSLVLPRNAAGTSGQYSIVHRTIQEPA